MHHAPDELGPLRKGDYVIVDPDALVAEKWKGVVYRIDKVNTTTYGLKRADGGPAGVRFDKGLVIAAPVEMVSAALNKAAELPTLHNGNLVKVKPTPGWKEDPDRVFVVITVRVNGYDITRLGGMNGQFYKEMPPGLLQRLDGDQYELILK